MDDNSDWRAALSDYYSSNLGVQQLSLLENDSLPLLPKPRNAEKDLVFGRFPPPFAPVLLQPIEQSELVFKLVDENFSREFDGEIMAGFRFLGGLLMTCISKAFDQRNNVIELQLFISSLKLERFRMNLPQNELESIRCSISKLKELQSLSYELQNADIRPTFAIESINRSLNLDLSSDGRRKIQLDSLIYSLVGRASSLLTAVECTTKCIEELIDHCQAIYYLALDPNNEPLSKLKMIKINWPAAQRESVNYRSSNFASYMNALSLPVCDTVYSYSSHPRIFAFCLAFPAAYSFAPQEFAGILSYFHLQHSLSKADLKLSEKSIAATMKELVLVGCSIGDKDCHILASHMRIFSALNVLDLGDNAISSSGVSSIIAAIFALGSSCHLRSLMFDRNHIDCSGATVIGEALGSGKSLLQLEMLSIAGNPVKNKGIWQLLKSTMNKYRKAYQQLQYFKLPPEADEEMNSQSDADIEKQPILRPILPHCYFADYFHSSSLMAFTQKTVSESQGIDSSSETMGSWFSPSEESFWMEGGSEYSSSHEDSDQEDDKHVAPKAVSLPLIQPPTSHTPKLVAHLLKLRLKLAAVSAFSRLRGRGHILSYMDISHCNISKEAFHFITPILIDNHNIKSIDISHNKILTSKESCQAMSKILAHSALKSVKLNGCGINDEGLQTISMGIMTSSTLESIEMSDNRFGPTGANWIASLSRTFYIDDLVLKNGLEIIPFFGFISF